MPPKIIENDGPELARARVRYLVLRILLNYETRRTDPSLYPSSFSKRVFIMKEGNAHWRLRYSMPTHNAKSARHCTLSLHYNIRQCTLGLHYNMLTCILHGNARWVFVVNEFVIGFASRESFCRRFHNGKAIILATGLHSLLLSPQGPFAKR